MKNNHIKITKISGRVLVVLVSLCMVLSLLIVDIPMAYAAEESEEPTPTETPVPTEEPEPAEPPAEDPTETPTAEEPTPPADVTDSESGADEVQIIEVDGAECVAGEVIVKFRDAVPEEAALGTLGALDSDVQQELPADDLVITQVPEGETVEAFIETLESQPNVEYAQPNYAYALDVTVNDPGVASQWYLGKIGAYTAWDITAGSSDVRVAVLDTGIDIDHPEFAGQIYAQTDVVNNDGSADDDNGHGTHVAGIIAARANNGAGIAGVAPGVKLIIADVFNGDYALTSDVIEGIHYAVNQGASVLNLSLGCKTYDYAFEQALAEVTGDGVVCVVAAGNDSSSGAYYPADFDCVISVIATTSADVKADYSNYGVLKDISAPGSSLYSTYLYGGYTWMSGTSMAAPVVSAVAALVLSANPDLTVAEVKEILYTTAADLGSAGRDDTYGYGRVDAYAAVGTASEVSELCTVTAVASLRDNSTMTDGSAYCTISGAGRYAVGTTATLTAVPKDGYRFVCWADETGQLSGEAMYAFEVTASCTVTAEFAVIGTPSVAASSAGYNSVYLSWAAIDGAAGYEVWRSASAGGGYIKIATITGTAYGDTGLATNTTYYYRTNAYCTASTATTYGSQSASASATPVPSAPEAAYASAASYSSASVSWAAVAGASGYQVYRAASPDGTYSLVKTTSATSFTNTSLSTGRTYYYKVRAYRTVGRSKAYGSYSGIAAATPALSSVTTAYAAAYYPTSIKVSWGSVSGRTKYEVWRAAEDGAYTLIATTSSTYYKDTKCTPFVSYSYYIKVYRTVSGQKVYSGASSPTATAMTILMNVTNVNAAMSSASSVKVTWSSVYGTSGYEVWRCDTIDGTYTLVKSTTGKSYTDSSLIPNQTYYYKVVAYRQVGSERVRSAYSSPISATPYLGPVTGASAVRSSATKIKLTWSAVSGRTGYEIYRAASPDGEFVSIGTTTSTSYSNSGLATGVTVYYKIRAYKTVNGVRYYSQTLADAAVVSATP